MEACANQDDGLWEVVISV